MVYCLLFFFLSFFPASSGFCRLRRHAFHAFSFSTTIHGFHDDIPFRLPMRQDLSCPWKTEQGQTVSVASFCMLILMSFFCMCLDSPVFLILVHVSFLTMYMLLFFFFLWVFLHGLHYPIHVGGIIETGHRLLRFPMVRLHV
ncbi:hypothetical protein ASPWEDRAFT_546684 [Aspergillus wentii DTO 134E9]|uniref:Uncharacterized protein n=1 Tax=Aspergillus wentii DTO 134E9 TaxID=1073089 RepID=A0A1L9RG02_ASPWE|nr:uncharacterized protein ASPWEDRAFT_546684 [Aspergillus wentii DTO 134E9]OJJ33855.1 hypothetical protein ASPWEDRAFT_546684 [Aspergillus wentii DTO 134E9]